MKIIQLGQKYASHLGISTIQSVQERLLNRQNVCAIVVLSLSTILSLIPLSRDVNTFAEYTFLLATFSSMLVATIIFTIIVWEMRPLFECLNMLEDGVNLRLEKPESRILFEECDLKTEKITKIVITFNQNVFFPVAMMLHFVFSFYMYYFTDSGNDAFELAIPFWYPFDWKNPTGYLVAFGLQCITMLYINLLISVALCTGIGIYMWSMAYLTDIETHLKEIGEIQKQKKEPQQLSEKLSDVIDSHSRAIEVWHYGSDVVQPVFLTLFTWAIIGLCGTMLLFNSSLKTEANGLLELVVPIVIMVWALGLVFISCELAGRMSSEFDEIEFWIGQFKWYLFPHKIQQMLPVIMINSQQEMGFECFGSVMCNRETFKRVVNASFSYFMVLREY